MSGYSFEDLEVYKRASEFRKKIYSLTNELPGQEKYNLISQMRRAALSTTNCIAEGHGHYHYQEEVQFLRQSRGSIEELIDDLNVCLDEDYVEKQRLFQLKEEAYDVIKKLTAILNISELRNHLLINQLPFNQLTRREEEEELRVIFGDGCSAEGGGKRLPESTLWSIITYK